MVAAPQQLQMSVGLDLGDGGARQQAHAAHHDAEGDGWCGRYEYFADSGHRIQTHREGLMETGGVDDGVEDADCSGHACREWPRLQIRSARRCRGRPDGQGSTSKPRSWRATVGYFWSIWSWCDATPTRRPVRRDPGSQSVRSQLAERTCRRRTWLALGRRRHGR